ncbi:MAG: DUF2169 domain-containing protein [Burkholderiaceae bacterium]|jgi:hypothetical protein|nr:DUF2169 domain-containing protein [Burkholderiaceae bacterium]
MNIVVRGDTYATTAFPSRDVTGQEYLVMVAKATWKLPLPGQRLKPIAPQPIKVVDEYYGEPGLSALRCPNDLARIKSRCDVLFDAKAYVPHDKATTHLAVKVCIGDWSKVLKVVGERRWKRSLISYAASDPVPFSTMPLHMGRAFGGARKPRRKGAAIEVYDDNPVGIGWAGKYSIDDMVGESLPNLEPINKNLTSPTDKFKPIALNAIGVNFPERSRYAGTYDEAWRRNVFPFLPEDFDDRYYQAAPEDQQIPYPRGQETIELTHLLPDRPHLEFTLPALDQMQMRVLRKNYVVDLPPIHVDTLFFELDQMRLSAVWRSHVRVHRSINEFHTIAMGRVDEHWWDDLCMGVDDAQCLGCSNSRL